MAESKRSPIPPLDLFNTCWQDRVPPEATHIAYTTYRESLNVDVDSIQVTPLGCGCYQSAIQTSKDHGPFTSKRSPQFVDDNWRGCANPEHSAAGQEQHRERQSRQTS